MLLYIAVPKIWMKNGILILFSLVFYAWGEPLYVVLLILSALVILAASAAVRIHHVQVPVIQDRDIPVASVTLPEGTEPEFKVSLRGWRRKALRSWAVRDGFLYVNLDGARIRDIRKPFTLKIKAE